MRRHIDHVVCELAPGETAGLLLVGLVGMVVLLRVRVRRLAVVRVWAAVGVVIVVVGLVMLRVWLRGLCMRILMLSVAVGILLLLLLLLL